MTTILAVDPGEEHCGLAVFQGGECVWTGEKEPVGLFDWLALGAALWSRDTLQWDTVVVEEFRLFPKRAAAQAWSRFGTVEVIGALKEWCRRERVELVMQPASVLKPTASILRARGIELRSKGAPHARSAEQHGWHYLMAAGLLPRRGT